MFAAWYDASRCRDTGKLKAVCLCSECTARPAAPVPSPIAEAVPSPTAEAVPSPTAEAVPSPTAEAVPSPTPEAVLSPTAEAVPSPTAEAVRIQPMAARVEDSEVAEEAAQLRSQPEPRSEGAERVASRPAVPITTVRPTQARPKVTRSGSGLLRGELQRLRRHAELERFNGALQLSVTMPACSNGVVEHTAGEAAGATCGGAVRGAACGGAANGAAGGVADGARAVVCGVYGERHGWQSAPHTPPHPA